jgi:hypothetical protein
MAVETAYIMWAASVRCGANLQRGVRWSVKRALLAVYSTSAHVSCCTCLYEVLHLPNFKLRLSAAAALSTVG